MLSFVPRSINSVMRPSLLRSASSAAGFAALVSLSCGESGSAAGGGTAQPVALADMISVVDTLDLEETDEVIYVNPLVSLSIVDSGTYLIADRAESQIRRVGPDGRILWSAGRRGAGPGEYDDPRIAIELADGSVLVAESMGRFTFLTGGSPAVQHTASTPFRNLQDVALVNDSLVLVTARLAGDGHSGPRLHVWHLASERILRSFLAPFDNAPVRDAAIIGGYSMFAVRSDTVAAVWSLADSLYLYSIDGSRLETVALASSFRPAHSPPPGRTASERERSAWLGGFDFLSGVWWLGDDHILLQYFEMLPEEGMSRRHHLLLYSRRDGSVREARNTPRVITSGSAGDKIMMLDPEAEVPNRWLVAKPRL